MQKNVLKVGVLGTGEWTRNVYLPTFQQCENARVVAVCGQDENRNRNLAEQFAIPQTYTDHRELLERADVGLIVISTSSNRHFSLAL